MSWTRLVSLVAAVTLGMNLGVIMMALIRARDPN